MRIDRRRFFGFTLAGMAAACLAPFRPKPNPAPGLVFDPDSGISMRFVQHFDPNCAQRIDVLYGYMINPELACRIREP